MPITASELAEKCCEVLTARV